MCTLRSPGTGIPDSLPSGSWPDIPCPVVPMHTFHDITDKSGRAASPSLGLLTFLPLENSERSVFLLCHSSFSYVSSFVDFFLL